MNKYITFLLAILLLVCLLIPAASATFSLSNYKEYTPIEGSKYGKIDVWDGNLIFPDEKIKTFTLLENTKQCLIDCYRIVNVTLLKEARLFDDVKYFNGNVISSKDYIVNGESYQIDVDDYGEVCKDVEVIDNKTSLKEIVNKCTQEKTGTHKETRYRDKEYKGEYLPAGNYTIRGEGKKSPTASIDWQIETDDVLLDEWAWWDSNWDYKKEINIIGAIVVNSTVYITIPKTASMNDTFSDLRFLNETEDGQLGYWINRYNTTEALVAVKVDNNNSIFVYYGNALAISTSNIKDAFLLGMDWRNASISSLTGTGFNAMKGGTNSYTATGLVVAGGSDKGIETDINYTQSPLVVRLFNFSATSDNYPDLHSSPKPDDCDANPYSNIQLRTPNNKWSIYSGVDPAWNGDGIAGKNYSVTAVYLTSTISSYSIYDNDLYGKVNISGINGTGAAAISGRYIAIRNVVGTSFAVGIIQIFPYINPAPTYTLGAEESSSGVTATLSYPANAFSTNVNTVGLGCNFTSTGTTNISSVNVTVWNATSVIKYGNTIGSLNTQSYNATWTTSALTDGTYHWGCGATGDDGTNSTTANRTFTVDTAAPTLNITYPATSVNYISASTNLTINFTASDGLLDSCWYSFNGGVTNSSANCTEGNFTMLVTSSSNDTATIYANDTLGNENSFTRTWTYDFIFMNETFVSPVMEGSTNQFAIVFDADAVPITTAYLTYNNTIYTGSISSSGTIYTLTRSVVAPTVSAATNVSFFWNLTKSDASNYVTALQNQTVNSFGISTNCTSHSIVLYNFTMVDEEARTELDESTLNTSGKVDLTIYSTNRVTTVADFSGLYYGVNPFAVCIDTNLSAGESYVIDTQIEYSAPGYAKEFYNIQNATLNSASLYNNITLYDLNSTQAQEFILIVRDTKYLPIYNALVYVKRKYVDIGTFYNVEVPKTDATGQAVASLQLNDVIYTFVIVKNGVIISTFDNVHAVCQTPSISTCEIDFNAFSSTITVPDYETDGDLNFTLGYNSTSRAVSSIFDITSGEPAVMTLNITREDALGTAICTDTLTSASGTLSCTVASSFGNSTTLAVLYRNGVEVAKGNINLAQSPKDIYGAVLVYLVMFIFLTTVGIGLSDSPVLFAGWMLLGVILLFATNIIQNNGFIGATATILFLVIAIILVVIKMSRRS